mgnify:CR=1 FL=1
MASVMSSAYLYSKNVLLPPGVHGRGKGLLEPGREVQMFILRDEGQAVEEESFVMDIGFLILREQGI